MILPDPVDARDAVYRGQASRNENNRCQEISGHHTLWASSSTVSEMTGFRK